MNKNEKSAISVEELVALTKDASVQRIIVHGGLVNVPSVRLSPGQFLRGDHEHASVTFAAGADGFQLSSDNRVHNIHLHSHQTNARSSTIRPSRASAGSLRGVTTIGCVPSARDKVRGGHVDVNGLDIVAASAWRERTATWLRRPCPPWRVHALEHAADNNVIISADLSAFRLARRRAGSGSGIFVSGGGDKAGRLNVRVWRLMQSTAMAGSLPTSDQITGGVFTVYGAHVDVVRDRGPVVTYGVNEWCSTIGAW